MDLLKLDLIGVIVLGLVGILSKLIRPVACLARSRGRNPGEREEHAAEAFARLREWGRPFAFPDGSW